MAPTTRSQSRLSFIKQHRSLAETFKGKKLIFIHKSGPYDKFGLINDVMQQEGYIMKQNQRTFLISWGGEFANTGIAFDSLIDVRMADGSNFPIHQA